MENRLRYTSGYMARRPHENFDCNAVVFKIPKSLCAGFYRLDGRIETFRHGIVNMTPVPLEHTVKVSAQHLLDAITSSYLRSKKLRAKFASRRFQNSSQPKECLSP